MSCNIGYRRTVRASTAKRARGSAPRVDQDLLDRIGAEDPDFLDWLQGLDMPPLLKAALDRTRLAVGGGVTLTFGADGFLDVEAPTQAQADRALTRWQLEVIAVIAQVLGYETRVSGTTLDAAKPEHGESFRVTLEGGSTSLRFEHFKTRDSLDDEMRKLLALLQRAGIDIRIQGDDDDGPGTQQRVPLREPQ